MVNRKKERQEGGRGNVNRGRGRKTNNIGIGQGRNEKGNENLGGRFFLGRGTWMFTGRVGNTSIIFGMITTQ